jgi:transposase InsO family protein
LIRARDDHAAVPVDPGPSRRTPYGGASTSGGDAGGDNFGLAGRLSFYLVVVMDWAARKVLAWRVSNTMDVVFCVAAAEEARIRFGLPEIFNTDQGSQFTSPPVHRHSD